MSNLVIGVNAYHGDSSACIFDQGRLVVAVEEERFRRIKHWAGFPSHAVNWCLKEVGASLSEVEHVALNQDSGANLWKKIGFAAANRPDLSMIVDKIRTRRQREDMGTVLERELGEPFRGKVHFVEHHLAHLASAFLVSPFESASVVSIDGMGDFASAAWGIGEDDRVDLEEKVYFPHSLGIFYEALTQYLGFRHYGDEYKIMGLAPYGQPKYMDAMRQIVLLRPDGSYRLNLAYFRHASEKIEYQWDGGEPKIGVLFSAALEQLLGPSRAPEEPIEAKHRDLARSVQAMYEEAAFNLLNAVHDRHRNENLALAGGCAMNSVANGKVYRNTAFRRIYVQAAAGDAGGAIGAALVAHQRINGYQGRAGFAMDHAYWGPRFSNAEVEAVLQQHQGRIASEGCQPQRIEQEEVLFGRTAEAIAAGKVVGWFQGRMEWGPRALGNRSIVCDPRRGDMKDILNAKIKRRESFRPFAPSILREEVSSWFEVDDDVPFMMQVYPIREEKRAQIPAVTHVDGTGRLQTVTRETNPRYHGLIDSFRQLTGVPLVLNTSFNENEPIVCKPEEALDCFLRTKMDVLVMGDWFISRA
jgi:carbamoyltransferase